MIPKQVIKADDQILAFLDYFTSHPSYKPRVTPDPFVFDFDRADGRIAIIIDRNPESSGDPPRITATHYSAKGSRGMVIVRYSCGNINEEKLEALESFIDEYALAPFTAPVGGLLVTAAKIKARVNKIRATKRANARPIYDETATGSASS